MAKYKIEYLKAAVESEGYEQGEEIEAENVRDSADGTFLEFYTVVRAGQTRVVYRVRSEHVARIRAQ
jgi:hypothetical protein